MRLSVLLTSLGAAALVGCTSHPFEDRRDDVAREAIAAYVERGEVALPELAELAESDDMLVRARARTAIGKITGQWGSRIDGIHWKRSVEEAVNEERPLVVLQLFGNFDEEFC